MIKIGNNNYIMKVNGESRIFEKEMSKFYYTEKDKFNNYDYNEMPIIYLDPNYTNPIIEGWRKDVPLDLTHFDMSKVTNTESMFQYANIPKVKLGEKSLVALKANKTPSTLIFYVPDNKLQEARTTYNTKHLPDSQIQPWSVTHNEN